MMWYLIAIPIVAAIVVKLVIPYIRKNYIDDTVFCGICGSKYSKRLKGCPKCGVGQR